MITESLLVILKLCFLPVLHYPVLVFACVALAIICDLCFGELRRCHPIIGLGKLAIIAERWAYPDENAKLVGFHIFVRGVVAMLLVQLVAVSVVLLAYAVLWSATEQAPLAAFVLISIPVLYISIAPRSLIEHGRAVEQPLIERRLDEARLGLSMIVSRDTGTLQERQIAAATIETMTENENDAVVAPLFWFLICGPVGAVIFKTANTLDSMWGYKNERYLFFGRAAARCDDVLGFIPARLTVLLITMNLRLMWNALAEGAKWYSPNAGPVMAAGALKLGVSLGGDAKYFGGAKSRPTLGFGSEPNVDDLSKTLALLSRRHQFLLLLCILASGVSCLSWFL